MKSQHAYFACVVLVLVGSAGLQLHKRVQTPPSAPSGTSGRSNTVSARSEAHVGTSAAILDRVEPLCRALLPEQGTLHFTMSPQVSHLKTGQRRSFWLVECLDAQDRHLVHVLWDATSSRVVMIGRSESFEDMPAMRGRHTIDSTHALDRAREWAHTLHLASRAELAASAHKLIPEGDVICVRLFPSSGEVIVWVSSRTGAILNTHVHNGYDHPADPHNSRYIAAKHPDPPHA